MESVSAHFTLEEVQWSFTADRHGIDNTIPEKYKGNAKVLAVQVLEPVREAYGPFSPTSWYRSPKLNTKLKGSKSSQHMLGEAADCKISRVPTAVLAQFIADNLQFDQLILECFNKSDSFSGWTHVSYSKGKNRKELLVWDGKSYTKVESFREFIE